MTLEGQLPELGTVVRDWRSRRRLSQSRLADLAQVSARHLSFVENGRARPSRELLLRLTDHLGVPVPQRDALLVRAGYAPLSRPAPGPAPAHAVTRAAVVQGIGGWTPAGGPPAHRPGRCAMCDGGVLLGGPASGTRTPGTGADAKAAPGTDTGGTGVVEAAVEAGRRALRSAGAPGVDALLLATATPGRSGDAAPRAAARLGLAGVAAFEVSASCAGFLYGLASAAALVTSGTVGRALLIGADVVDGGGAQAGGAGAVVLGAGAPGQPGAVGGVVLGGHGGASDGTGAGAHETRPARPGPEARGELLRRAGLAALRGAGWETGQVDGVLAHPAVPGLPEGPPVVCAGGHGAGALPSLLAGAVAEGRLGAGDRVLLAGLGEGAVWGAAALCVPARAAEPVTA
ncbi:helix-turn-helix domain-containing protein [Streptomyces sp. NPDC004783]|uniref:helix-turn-helix domain-containing protein n=1 Tax=Streptomyces sp. NPDC004783 TaxID=3154459 RepID=UPI0033BBAA96